MADTGNSLQSLSELIGREPPYMIDAERAVISAVLVDPTVFSDVLQIINKPEYFYDEYLRGIFSACYWLDNQGKPIDVVTVIDTCVETGVFTAPDMARSFIKQLLDNLHIQWVCSPLHHGYLDSGVERKDHYHVIVIFKGKKSLDQIQRLSNLTHLFDKEI